MASKIKYDRLSKEFIGIFNEITSNEDGEDFVLKYLNEYIRLIDAYIGYNERILYQNYLEDSKKKLSWTNENKIDDKKTFGFLNNHFSTNEDLTTLVNIRNMITHNFWMYSNPNEHWENIGDYSAAVKYFVENTLPKNFKDILPKKIGVSDFPSQKDKFENDMKTKAEYLKHLL